METPEAPKETKPSKPKREPCACRTGGRCIWHTLDPETQDKVKLLRGHLIRHSPKPKRKRGQGQRPPAQPAQ